MPFIDLSQSSSPLWPGPSPALSPSQPPKEAQGLRVTMGIYSQSLGMMNVGSFLATPKIQTSAYAVGTPSPQLAAQTKNTELLLATIPPLVLTQLESHQNHLAPPSPSAVPHFLDAINRKSSQETSSTLMSKAMKALVQQKSADGASFIPFNLVVDEMKKNDPHWEEMVSQFLEKISGEELTQLSNLSPSDLRGYDREMTKLIYEKILFLSKDPEMSAKVDKIVLSLETHLINNAQLKYLGGGAVNKVYKVTYQEDGVEKTAVFKPDPAELPKRVLFKEKYFGTATASGIPPGAAGHLPARSVASSAMDRLYFGTPGVCVKTTYTIVNGQRGILMEQAAGQSPKVGKIEKSIVNLDDFISLKAHVEKRGIENLNPKELSFMAVQMKWRKLEIEKGPDGSQRLVKTEANVVGINPRNATTAKGLLQAQIFDWLTGQVDRHPGNYFIDEQGKVMCIDNDCSFGVNSVKDGVDVRNQSPIFGVIPNNSSLMLRLPPAITQELKDQILRISPEDLETELVPYLSKEEIKATLMRREALVDHINGPLCQVVESDEALLSGEAFESIDSNNSYWGRELLVYDNDKKGWNYLRAPRQSY